MTPKKVHLSIDERRVTMHGGNQIVTFWRNIHVHKVLKLSIPDEDPVPQVLKRRVLQNVYTYVYTYGEKIACH